jgi:hypothetical protein
MKKADLMKLYWRCGEVLHRGSFKNIEKPPSPKFDEIGPICVRIATQLAFHRIAFLQSEDELWVQMDSPESNKVSASLRRSA